jgi:hypothetical protein
VLTGASLHPSQKFERPPFRNGWSYGIKIYGVEVTFNDMTFLLNFVRIYQFIQKLMVGELHREDGDLISVHFYFSKESRLKINVLFTEGMIMNNIRLLT